MATHGSWDIVVVGGVNWDFLVRGPHLPQAGETVLGDELQEAPGGKGANQAIAAARLGARVALVARVGNDARGAAAVDKLAREGVNVDHVVCDPVLKTGVALVMVDWNGEKQILTAPGANGWLTISDIKSAAGTIEQATVLLTQLEVPLETVREGLQLAHRADVEVLLDPAPATPLSNELLQFVNVIRPNAGEARVLTGVPVKDRGSARQAAHILMTRGVKAVVVQAGDEGNLIVTAEEERLLPKIAVPSVDSTGAGDAFAASLAVMRAEGKSLIEAATFAHAAAALKTTVLGAQAGLPNREMTEALLATHSLA